VSVAREGHESDGKGHATRGRGGIGLEGHVLDMRADALRHPRGVVIGRVEEQDGDPVTRAGDDVGGAEELGDLAGDGLLHGFVRHGRDAIGLDQTDREEVLVARGARGLPGQELVKSFFSEDAARRIHEVGHG
jgi:hypothetical protein